MTNSRAVLITGCSSGVGRAAALRLVQAGYPVYATARRPETVAPLAGAGATTLAVDVTDEESMTAAVARVEDDHGAVGVLINNAAYGLQGAGETVNLDQARAQVEANLFRLVPLTQLVLPAVRAQGPGPLIHASSMGGPFCPPGAGGPPDPARAAGDAGPGPGPHHQRVLDGRPFLTAGRRVPACLQARRRGDLRRATDGAAPVRRRGQRGRARSDPYRLRREDQRHAAARGRLGSLRPLPRRGRRPGQCRLRTEVHQHGAEPGEGRPHDRASHPQRPPARSLPGRDHGAWCDHVEPPAARRLAGRGDPRRLPGTEAVTAGPGSRRSDRLWTPSRRGSGGVSQRRP